MAVQIGGGGGMGWLGMAPLIFIFAIFYFVLLRPEQRRRRDQEKLISGIRRNDLVVLSCGLHGRVVTLNDKLVTVEVAPKVQMQFDRTAIQSVETAGELKEREK